MPATKVPRFSTGLLAQIEVEGISMTLALERLFDDLPNVVFFLKDCAGCYIAVNRTLTERSAHSDKAALLGRRPSDFFPKALAAHYEKQDQQVLRTGRAVLDQLELHLYPDRRRGWCLTNKYPVPNCHTGEIVAIMGISRDVQDSAHGSMARGFPELALGLEAMQARIANPPSMEELAAISGVSSAHFSRLVRRTFRLTPRQLAMKVRLDEALHLLSTTDQSLSDIALSTGFCDQSAFTRHFRKVTGIPPGAFRQSTAAIR